MDQPRLTAMDPNMFVEGLWAWLKQSELMRLYDGALQAYISVDYDQSPLRANARSNRGDSVINPSHPLLNNYTGMVNRTIRDKDVATNSHANDVHMEPCWNGFYCIGVSNSKDKFAFASYVMYLDQVLGTKPNHSHTSSSSMFAVDRTNNNLHYSIDNIRWASAATNFHNRSPNNNSNRATDEQNRHNMTVLRRTIKAEINRSLRVTFEHFERKPRPSE